MPLEGYLSEYCGTVGYMAPEIIAKQPYNFKVDSYSLGILIYELETNKMPVFNG
jgi:serine/threonine protein kinase